MSAARAPVCGASPEGTAFLGGHASPGPTVATAGAVGEEPSAHSHSGFALLRLEMGANLSGAFLAAVEVVL